MRKALPLIMALFLLGGCVTGGKKPVTPAKTQMQIREFQTRTYDITDHKMVMKAVLNVLQDDGYIVKNAVIDLGLITADKEYSAEDESEKNMAIFWHGPQATYTKAASIEASVNVTVFGDVTKVRTNFVRTLLDNKGGIVEIDQIDDQKFYQEYYAKVDKGVFLQKEQL